MIIPSILNVSPVRLAALWGIKCDEAYFDPGLDPGFPWSIYN